MFSQGFDPLKQVIQHGPFLSFVRENGTIRGREVSVTLSRSCILRCRLQRSDGSCSTGGIHHPTNGVDVKIDGKPFRRWEFFASKRPEAENFAREKAYKLTGPITIVAEATHNTHGREGSKTWTVTLAPEENEARARLTNPSAGPW